MVDLFEQYEQLPTKVKDIIDRYSLVDNSYDMCDRFTNELNKVGYTCEYGLDAEPHSLRKLTDFDKWSVDDCKKVFNAMLDEMSNSDKNKVLDEVKTNADIVKYFIVNENKFVNTLK